MRDDRTCAVDMPLDLLLESGSLLGVQVRCRAPAKEMATSQGLLWDTVRQRRYRGDPWTMALHPDLRKSRFNDPAPCLRPKPETKAVPKKGIEMEYTFTLPKQVAILIGPGLSPAANLALMDIIREAVIEHAGLRCITMATSQGANLRTAEVEDEIKKTVLLLDAAS